MGGATAKQEWGNVLLQRYFEKPAKRKIPTPTHLQKHAPTAGGGRQALPVGMDNMLLRGCTLKNSGSIAGLVAYAGADTRIQMNAARTPLKVGTRGWNSVVWCGVG